jgi:hypothetical protein
MRMTNVRSELLSRRADPPIYVVPDGRTAARPKYGEEASLFGSAMRNLKTLLSEIEAWRVARPERYTPKLPSGVAPLSSVLSIAEATGRFPRAKYLPPAVAEFAGQPTWERQYQSSYLDYLRRQAARGSSDANRDANPMLQLIALASGLGQQPVEKPGTDIELPPTAGKTLEQWLTEVAGQLRKNDPTLVGFDLVEALRLTAKRVGYSDDAIQRALNNLMNQGFLANPQVEQPAFRGHRLN